MKKIIYLVALTMGSYAFSQVGIGTQNPQGVFHVDAAKDNAATGAPTATQQVNDFFVGTDGKTGIGTVSPSEILTVTGASPADIGVYAAVTVPPASDVVTSQIKIGISKDWHTSIRSVLPSGSIGTDLLDLQFATGNASNDNVQIPRLTVKAVSGNVGIGTVNPNSRLDVKASLKEVARFTSTQTGTNFAHIAIGNDTGVWTRLASGSGMFAIRNYSTDATVLHADLATGNIGIGNSSPGEKLEVTGKTKTTNFQMTNGASANFVMTSDASGNGIWQNAQTILVNKVTVTPPSGSNSVHTIPCNATFDIIQLNISDANFATTIVLPSPLCAFAGQKARVTSSSATPSTISKINTNTYGTTLVSNGDVYEYTFSNGRWEMTAFPTKNYPFCGTVNNNSLNLVAPSSPKTIFYFEDGCYGNNVVLPSAGNIGDIIIIDDRATFNLNIKATNTTMGADFLLVTGSYVQFIKTNLGWVKQF